MSRRRGALFAAAVVMTARQVRADDDTSSAPRFVPTIEVGTTYVRDSLAIDTGTTVLEEQRASWVGRLGIGLDWRVLELAAHTKLAGHSGLGLGLAFDPGDWLVCTRHVIGPVYEPVEWFGLGSGLGLGACLNSGRLHHSYLEVPAPVAIRLAFVEVVYAPVLTLPLGSATTRVFGGERTDRVAVGVIPLDLTLRFLIPPLGW